MFYNRYQLSWRCGFRPPVIYLFTRNWLARLEYVNSIVLLSVQQRPLFIYQLCVLNVVRSNFITVEIMTCATATEASSKLLSTLPLIWNSRRRQRFRFEFQLINKMGLNYKLLRHMALNTAKTIEFTPLHVPGTVAIEILDRYFAIQIKLNTFPFRQRSVVNSDECCIALRNRKFNLLSHWIIESIRLNSHCTSDSKCLSNYAVSSHRERIFTHSKANGSMIRSCHLLVETV